jgi:hypothetical protein
MEALKVYGEQITSSPGPMSDCIQAALKAFVPFTVVRQYFDPFISAHFFSNSVTLPLRDQTRLAITSFILGSNFSESHCGHSNHCLSFPLTGVPPNRAREPDVSGDFAKMGVLPEAATIPVVAAATVPIKLRRLISFLFIFLSCLNCFFFVDGQKHQ